MNYNLYVVLNIIALVIIFAIIMITCSAPFSWMTSFLRKTLSKWSESLTVILETIIEYIPKTIAFIVSGCICIFIQQFVAIVYIVHDDCNWSKVVYWSGVKNLSDDPARPCVTPIEIGNIYVYNDGDKPYKISYPKKAIVQSHEVYAREIIDEDDRELFEKKQLDRTFQQDLFDRLFEW